MNPERQMPADTRRVYRENTRSRGEDETIFPAIVSIAKNVYCNDTLGRQRSDANIFLFVLCEINTETGNTFRARCVFISTVDLSVIIN